MKITGKKRLGENYYARRQAERRYKSTSILSTTLSFIIFSLLLVEKLELAEIAMPFGSCTSKISV